MSNVVPFRKCGRCRGGVGEPVDLLLRNEFVMSLFACDACLNDVDAELTVLRPIFTAMIDAGVPNELANRTMTTLLELWTPERKEASEKR